MKTLSKILILLFSLNLLAFAHTIESLEVDELEAYKKRGIIVVDIRKDTLRKKHGLIPSSYRLTYSYFNNQKKHFNWEYNLVELIKEKNMAFVLVSQDGSKARKLAKKLYKEDKLNRIMYLKGGLNAWKKSHKKVVNY